VVALTLFVALATHNVCGLESEQVTLFIRGKEGKVMLKNVQVSDLVDRVNRMIAASRANCPADRETRLALAQVIEGVLHDTDRYAGYRYLWTEYLPADERTTDRVLVDDADTSARVYSVKPYKR